MKVDSAIFWIMRFSSNKGVWIVGKSFLLLFFWAKELGVDEVETDGNGLKFGGLLLFMLGMYLIITF